MAESTVPKGAKRSVTSELLKMAKEGEKSESEVVKKMSSPYDLSASDNPGNVITQVQLKGENYEEWAKAVKISLRARRKWGFIDGTHTEPETDTSKIEDWWTIQSMLVSWILNTIEPNLRSTIAYMENAKDLWDDIKERFSIVNGPRIQQLKSKLAECKQQGMTMVAYYGKLKILWDELANYEQIPQCKCGGCKCNIATKLEKRREEERVHQFLMGLDDEGYGTTRSNVLATDPLPSLNRVYATMVQEERVRTITRSKEERGMIVGMVVQTETKGKLRNEVKEKSIVCTHCGRTGHDKRNCFEIIGYPDWWGERPRNENKSGGRHQQRTTFFRGKGVTPRVNIAHTSTSSSDSKSDTKKPEVAGLSNEQWEILATMLNSHKANTTEKMTGPHFEDADWSG
ncbi:uncharacterized protein LOC108326303 isoform X5 [Vigna angularis]|uniref:uncharacterized protein LOC108326303 isoform X5 n=1 Tax=Phaseolus angularis TaxID=3914 RepID=UPI0022B308D7|nr:uncharacterized protein LOC108326303 isoform X5 [Vigna angularis]